MHQPPAPNTPPIPTPIAQTAQVTDTSSTAFGEKMAVAPYLVPASTHQQTSRSSHTTTAVVAQIASTEAEPLVFTRHSRPTSPATDGAQAGSNS